MLRLEDWLYVNTEPQVIGKLPQSVRGMDRRATKVKEANW